jgi:hypothetical protein
MRPQSAKNKGRQFQKEVRDTILSTFPELHPDDVRSTSMGAGGEDILLSHAARTVFPYSVECKNVERLNIWQAVDQVKDNCGEHTPLVAFKKNRHEAWVAIPMDHFMVLSQLDKRIKRLEKLLDENTSY